MAGGLAVGVLAYKPQLGFGVCVVLLATRNWRVILAAAVTVGAQALACWAWFGAEVFAAYARMLSTLPAIAPLVEPQQFQLCSLRGFFTALGVPGPPATVLSMALSAVVCWWVVVAWTRRSPASDSPCS